MSALFRSARSTVRRLWLRRMVLQGTRSLPQRIRAQPSGSRCKAKTSRRKARGSCFLQQASQSPINSKAKANQWLDRAGAPYINDYGVLAAGPCGPSSVIFIIFMRKSRTMNLLSPKAGGGSSAFPDKFPRSTGDNLVVFDSRPHGAISKSKPPKSGSNTIISGESKTVPEPSNHPGQPRARRDQIRPSPFLRER